MAVHIFCPPLTTAHKCMGALSFWWGADNGAPQPQMA